VKVYIAGPMRGRPYYNFPAFDAARDKLRCVGVEVISPADLDRAEGFEPLDCSWDREWSIFPEELGDRTAVLERDLQHLHLCDGLALLPGWRDSEGAQLEYAAAVGDDMPAMTVEQWVELCAALGNEPDALPDAPGADLLPVLAADRKQVPMYRGLFCYFPRALAAVAHHSYVGNLQHHADEPLHWDRSKSTDEEDALLRHVLEGDWTAVAWRALAKLEKHLEAAREAGV